MAFDINNAAKLAGKAKTAAGNLSSLIQNTAKTAAGNLSGFVQNQVIPGLKNIINGLLIENQPIADAGMVEIGKPYAFNENIDPYKRLSGYIRSKMSVIDLIPCQCDLNFSKIQKTTEGENPLGGGIFKISYTEKINLFNQICALHGLLVGNMKSPVCGIRLYTTDGTTATDSFNIQYGENVMQSTINSLSDNSRKLSNVARSLGINSVALGEKVIGETAAATKGAVEKMGVKKISAEATEKMIVSLGEVLLKGNRISFPKIWQNSTYNNALSAQIRLVSPYGHPKAIKQFIIRPLMFLLILASPHTIDGLSYGDAIPLTIKAYGMNYTVLGSINSISLRRGGEDTSFNVYRQPLVVDVSIDFQTLLEGFAVFKPYPEKQKDLTSRIPDYNIYAMNANLEEPASGVINKNTLSDVNYPLMTMGKFLTSLEPVQIVEGDFQIYGNFLRPDKSNIPKSGISGTLAGGVSSAAATNPSKLDPFSYALNSAKETANKLGLNVKSLRNIGGTIKDKFKTNFKF